jgi:hypothetical protein
MVKDPANFLEIQTLPLKLIETCGDLVQADLKSLPGNMVDL